MVMRKHFMSLAFVGVLCVALLTAGAIAYANSESAKTGVHRVPVNASKIIKIDDVVKRVSIGNPAIVEYTMLSKDEILLLGVKVGRTELNLWTENSFSTYVVYVYDDVIELRAKIEEIMGASTANAINIHVAKETAVIKGVVHSSYESEQIEKVTGLYYPKVLNLIEVKNKPAVKVEVSKKLVVSSAPEQAADVKEPATTVPPAPEVKPVAQNKESVIGNDKDILEIRSIEKYSPNENVYGAGASTDPASEAPLSSMTLKKSDYERANTKTTKIVPLQNGVATEIQMALDKVKSLDGSVIKDDRTNSLILIDKPAMIEKMVNLIKVLDAATPQVLIEAKIVEVALNDDMTNTLNWIYDTLYSGSNPLSTALNSKSVKVSSGDLELALDYGKISSDHLATKIMPSLKNRHARLLSSPSTVTLDKKEAVFAVTDNIPYLKYTPQGTTGTLLPTPEFVNPAPGITLKVTPVINQDNVIRMNLNIQIGSFVENVSFGQYGTVPRTSTRSTTNIVEVKNGETLIISGLIQNNLFKSANKVPWFSKVPFFGKLFSNKITGESRTEIVMFITPRVVGKDSKYGKLDAEKYPNITENKLPDVDDELKVSELFGSKKDDREVKKTVQSEFVIPKVTRDMLEAPKTAKTDVIQPEAEAAQKPVKAVQANCSPLSKDEAKFIEAPNAIVPESEKKVAKCESIKIKEDLPPAEAVSKAVKPKSAAKTKAVMVNEKPVLISETAVDKTVSPVGNKQAKFIYRDDKTQRMIESIRAKVVLRKK